jgi:ectoine hydroxylase-related dioxygenase (phytanoyl-CoA dioxygenase family)
MISLCDTTLQNGIILHQDKLDWISCPTNFGDIVLFNSYISHRSGPNKMNDPRKALYLTYNNAEEGYLRDEYYKNKIQNMETL